MDAKLKTDWVDALRSGEYEQGVMKFESNGRFCCLGVLCKVAGVPTIVDNDWLGVKGNWKYVTSVLPRAEEWKLADMNDTGSTFPEIADYIEKNIPVD